jgi:hypothetical protein
MSETNYAGFEYPIERRICQNVTDKNFPYKRLIWDVVNLYDEKTVFGRVFFDIGCSM